MALVKISETLSQKYGMATTGDDAFDIRGFMERKAQKLNEAVGYMDTVDGLECKKCLNRGDIAVAVEDYNGGWEVVHRPCKCMKVRNSIRQMQKSGLKNVIRDYTFDKFKDEDFWQQDLKRKAMEFSENTEGKWLFMGGQSGCGKTHLCTAVCRKFLLDGKEVRYMMWRDDIVKIKAVANDAETYAERINPLKTAEVLYIDDLFKTGRGRDGEKQWPTGADINVAFEIFNYRVANNLTTIISSECSIDDLLDIDEALGGRIYAQAGRFGTSIDPDRGKNYRIKGVTRL